MGIRDEEILRIKKYAEGLGIKVFMKPYKPGYGDGEWDCIDQSITIYTNPKQSKSDTILALLHELGHHLDWIYKNKEIPKEVIDVYAKLNTGAVSGDRVDLTKKERKVILDEEISGIKYMDVIHKELNLTFPLWKVKICQEMDIFAYRSLYNKARFPTLKEYSNKRKSLTKKLKTLYSK